MSVIGTAFIDIKPDMTGFGAGVQTGLSGTGSKVDEEGRKVGSRFGSAVKSAATIGIAAGVAGIGAFGVASVKAAEESEVAVSRLESVFASMGDSTGTAAAAAVDYAGALSRQIGVEDETIMAAQAKLATFEAVSNETARQSGIFDRATSAAADLAAAGFGTMESNATALGKALQDPERGMTALTRSGVTFTEEQKAQIQALMDAGRATEAQQLMLSAVETQVGGTAAATATATDKMSVAWGEAQESVGRILLPAVEGLANALTDTLIPAFESVVAFVSSNLDWLIPLAAAIAAVVIAVQGWALAQAILNAALWSNPIFLVAAAIAALVAGVVIAYQKVGWFRAGVDAAFRVISAAFGIIKDAALAVFDWLVSNWQTVLAVITGPIGVAVLLIRTHWETITSVIGAAIDTIIMIVTTGFNLLLSVVSAVWNTVVAATSAVWNAVRTAIEVVLTVIWTVISTYFNIYRTIVTAAWNALVAITSAIWNGIVAVISAYIGAITGVLSALIGTVASLFRSAWSGALNIVTGGIGSIVAAVSGIGGKILGYVQTLIDAGAALGAGLISGLTSAITGAAGLAGDLASAMVDALTSAWNTFANSVNDLIPNSIGWGPAAIDLPDSPIPTFATGGLVPGRRGAPLLAVVHGGEYITPVGGSSGAGAAVAIQQATFVAPADFDTLLNRMTLALAAGRV
jgi:phage-related protein